MKQDITGLYASAYSLAACFIVLNAVLAIASAQAVHRSVPPLAWVIPVVCLYMLINLKPDARITLFLLIGVSAGIRLVGLFRQFDLATAILYAFIEVMMLAAFVVALTGVPTKTRLVSAAATFLAGAAPWCFMIWFRWR